MALAKLCACACGGAIVGGGAVHVAEHRHVVRVRQVAHRTVPAHHVRRIVTRTTATCAPAVVTIAGQDTPIPLPAAPAFAPGGGEVVPTVIGGTGGFGGGFGSGFFGGFFGGGTGGSGGIVVSSTSSSSGNVAVSSSGNVSSSSSTGGASVGVDVNNSGNNSATAANDNSNSASNANSGNVSNTNSNINQNSNSQSQSQSQGQAQAQGQWQNQYGSSSKGWTSNGGTPPVPPAPPPGPPNGPPTPVPAPPMVLLFGAAALALVIRRWVARRTATA